VRTEADQNTADKMTWRKSVTTIA